MALSLTLLLPAAAACVASDRTPSATALTTAAKDSADPPQTAPTVPTPSTRSTAATTAPIAPVVTSSTARTLIEAAESQVGKTTGYDPAYVRLAYPGGDVDLATGVCSDVVVRAYRAIGLDLQELVHLDMRANFSEYPQRWGLRSPDTNIDHRRVPNLATFFTRKGAKRPVTDQGLDYEPGDVVTWTIGERPHTGIVTDELVDGEGRYFIVHNVGSGTQREDVLFAWPITGHYRWVASR